MSVETKNEQESILSTEATDRNFFSRQARSAPGRVAFWGFLVGGVAGLSGIIALTIGGGSVDQGLAATAVCGLAGAVVLATRFRWAPIVSTLLAAYLLYVTLTQPYAIESLLHPKTDPQGGFGHFVGVVILIAFEMVLLAGSVGAASQNYGRGRWQTPRWFVAAMGVVAGIVIGAILMGGITQEALVSGMTYTNGVPTVHMSAGSFLQSSVAVVKGSKLLLVDDVAATHVLANGSWQNGVPKAASETGAPVVNNVQFTGNSAQIGPFTTAGTYHIYCEIHQGMNLTITVQ